MEFKYRFKTPEEIDASCEEEFRDLYETEADYINRDLSLQVAEVTGNLYEIGRVKGFHPNEQEDETLVDAIGEQMDVINQITATLEENQDPGFEDMRLSTLIGYANAFGGIVRIQIEFDNGEKTELL